jgi:hypothetical protein
VEEEVIAEVANVVHGAAVAGLACRGRHRRSLGIRPKP